VLETTLYHDAGGREAVEGFYGGLLGLPAVSGWGDGVAFRVGAGGGRAARFRGELDDLRYAGTAIIAMPYEDRDALRAAADFLEVRKPVAKHTGKQQAQWLKPG